LPSGSNARERLHARGLAQELPQIGATVAMLTLVSVGFRGDIHAEEGAGASHFSVDLRLRRLRLSGPGNQRLVSVAPNKRRSPSRRSAFFRNLHEQSKGIVQASNGKRGASRNK